MSKLGMVRGTFAGAVRFDGAAISSPFEDRLVRALSKEVAWHAVISRAEGAVFVQRISQRSGDETVKCADTVRQKARSLFSAVARLDNREELGTTLGLLSTELAGYSDTDLLERVFERRGEAGIAQCLGVFGFARWEANVRRLTLGRDCVSSTSLVFHRAGGQVVFSNSLAILLSLPEVPRELDEIALANFMVVNPWETRRTAYRGIEVTPARSLVTIDLNGMRHREYWLPKFGGPPPYKRDEDYVERARELFEQAISAVTRDTDDYAIMLSGGLDSSAIAATLARHNPRKRIVCYTAVPPLSLKVDPGPRQYLDERDKVRALGRLYPALDLHLIAPEGLHPSDRDASWHFTRTSLPSLGPSDVGWLATFEEQVNAAGFPVRLIGAAGNAGLSWDGGFSLLALLQAGQGVTFAREWAAVARASGRSLPRVFLSDVLLPGVPATLRRFYMRSRGSDPGFRRYSTLNPTFVAETRLEEQWREQGFDPSFRPSGWNPARYRARLLFDRHLLNRDSNPGADPRRSFVSRDPHADRRLLEFALQVPEPLYRRNGVPRSFARTVFADRLPPEILNERRLGTGGGAWFKRMDALRADYAAEIERMEASATARRLIDIPRLKRLFDKWPADEHEAERRRVEYRLAFARAIDMGRFIRWVEGGNG
jgi:asparagine synthase (glutamine-hydrolysing)